MKTLLLVPTRECNANCSYCYSKNNLQKLSEEQCIIAINKFLNYFPTDHWNIIWHGGEPLILGKEYIKNVVRKINQSNIHWTIQTNGILLDDDWVSFFKHYNFTIGISYDCLNNIDTRGYNYNIKEKIDLLHKYKLNFTISSVLTYETAPYIIQNYNYIKSLSNHCTWSLNLVRGVEYTNNQLKTICLYLNDFYNYLCNSTQEKEFIFLIENYLKWKEKKITNMCYNFSCINNHFLLNCDGYIYSCNNFDNNFLIYGNYTDDFNKIFDKNNLKFKTYYNNKNKQINKCYKCKYLRVCNNGCPLQKNFDNKYCYFIKTCYDLFNITSKNNITNIYIKNRIGEKNNEFND